MRQSSTQSTAATVTSLKKSSVSYLRHLLFILCSFTAVTMTTSNATGVASVLFVRRYCRCCCCGCCCYCRLSLARYLERLVPPTDDGLMPVVISLCRQRNRRQHGLLPRQLFLLVIDWRRHRINYRMESV